MVPPGRESPAAYRAAPSTSSNSVEEEEERKENETKKRIPLDDADCVPIYYVSLLPTQRNNVLIIIIPKKQLIILSFIQIMKVSLDYMNAVQRRVDELQSVKMGNEQVGGKEWTYDDVFWVISVPEIWDDMSMDLMKDCAKIAGMKHFELGKEPIMAAFAVLHTANKSVLKPEKG